ncbi:efflux RND transporter periplasmic adaptor subunit [Candidatus Dependentiae bacterium]|nr:efflux RND transporter periplasmic adaptor subunit [Candidatus Dependentiae bacterium]
MKLKSLIVLLLTIVGISGAMFMAYKKVFHKQKKLPYTIQKPERRTIKKIIDTTGRLGVAEKVKIGSLVTGIIKGLYVEENDYVKKGQLLAEIDTGKDDTEVRSNQGLLDRAVAQYMYQKAYFARQKKLYQANQLAQDEFEQIERDYLTSKANLKIARAQLDKAKQEYENTKIFAKQDGIVIKVGVSRGERVTTDLDATVLFEIAKDVTKMEAKLEIDESNIGHVKVGQPIKFTIDSFPHKKFKTEVKQVSYSPKRKNGLFFYKATATVDNSEKLLRPGLSIDANIYVAKAQKALALTSHAFMISSRVLREIAKDFGYSFNPIDKQSFKKIKKETSQPVQTVWIVQRNGSVNAFVEKIVTTNITDDIYFEVTSGLSQEDEVIIDIEESGYLEEIYKKIFGNKF